MKVFIGIIVVMGLYILNSEIKKLNFRIESNYKINMNDMPSVVALLISEIIFYVAYIYRNEWSIDNTLVLMLLAFSMFLCVLYRNIKCTNTFYGLWITGYQIVVGILIMAITIIILKVLFPDKKRRND